jgi:hypothetical protein
VIQSSPEGTAARTPGCTDYQGYVYPHHAVAGLVLVTRRVLVYQNTHLLDISPVWKRALSRRCFGGGASFIYFLFWFFSRAYRARLGEMMLSDPANLSAKLSLSLQACRTHAILTAEQAIEIFKIGNDFWGKRRRPARDVGKAYGVSDKAVRDIWNGRTWYKETMHLDPSRSSMPMRLRIPGRPRRRAGTTVKGTLYLKNHGNGHSLSEIGEKADGIPSCTNVMKLKEDTFWPKVLLEVQPLPVSSDLNDPFHDDWEFWQAAIYEQYGSI